jgi:hypothetical protein
MKADWDFYYIQWTVYYAIYMKILIWTHKGYPEINDTKQVTEGKSRLWRWEHSRV